MARSVIERYLVAAFAFLAAAAWLGVGLENGFACLFAFVLTFQAVRVYQRRSDVRSRRAPSRRQRPTRHEPPSVEGREMPAPVNSGRDPAKRSSQLYDGDRDGIGWAIPSEATW